MVKTRIIIFLLLALSSQLRAAQEVLATNIDAGGTDLRCAVFLPITGGPTWPAALVVHGGNYNSLSPGPTGVCQDLANAGYVAFAVEYREAPPANAMTHAGPPGDPQNLLFSDGRPPQQTDDVQRGIQYARNPPITSAAYGKTNGKVVYLGFSCGGAHGAWFTIAGATNDDKPDAFVACSGPFDLDNADGLAMSTFRTSVENYINHTTDQGVTFHNAAQAASPYWLTVTSTPSPALLFNSTAETIATSIFTNMVAKYTSAGGTIESHLRTGTEHATDYWYLGYGGSFSTVKDCVIDFFNRQLGISPGGGPVGPAQIVLQRK